MAECDSGGSKWSRSAAVTSAPYLRNPERLYAARERGLLLGAALDALPPLHAWIIIRRFQTGMTLLQVALAGGIEINSVCRAYVGALAKLRREMHVEGVYTFRDIWWPDE